MTLANSVFAKASVAFVALATAFVLAAPAQAQMSEDDMQSEIDRLTALIEQLTASLGGGSMMGGSSSSVCPYTWTRTLNTGSTGMDVMKLQQFLNSSEDTRVAAAGSVGSAGMETEYYGPATGAAVAKFQEKYRTDILSPLGLVSATTFFGPSTMAHANQLCASAPVVEDDTTDDDANDDDDTDSGKTLGNDEGSIKVTSASSDENNLEEGMEGGVLAFDVEIEGDVEIDRVDVYAAEDGSASDDADDYFESASLWVDGEKVAELDVDDFYQNDYDVLSLDGDDYRLRFSGLGLVFEDGDEPEFQVAFEVVNNLDSNDIVTDWTAEVDSVRFVDGQGFSDTEESIGLSETFGFDEEEMAELKIKKSSDNPSASTLKIEEDDDESDEYNVFVFEIEEKNGIDVEVDDMTFTITTTGSTTESDVVAEAILYMGSTELASESVPNLGVVEFENLGIEIGGDDTEEFTVALIFKGAEDHGNASDVTVVLTSIDDAEDERGNDEGDMTISGEGLSSETHDLRTVVPEVTDVTSSITQANQVSNSGSIVFEFTIAAEDDDVVFTRAALDAEADLISSASTTLAKPTPTLARVGGDSSTEAPAGTFTVLDGDEVKFRLTYTFTTASAHNNGNYSINLDSIAGIEVDETSPALTLSH